MAEELQHLIDRIQTEGVDKAEQKASAIVSKARDRAAAIVAQAEEQAHDRLKQAEKDAEAFTERSIKTLEQAARDLLITVGQGVKNVLADIAGESTAEAMSSEVIGHMLVKIAEAYVARGGSESKLDVLASEADQKTLLEFFQNRYKAKLGVGLDIHVDHEILQGFQVSFKDGQVYHDFTREAVAEALSAFLRPHLAEIVHRVARESASSAEGSKA